MIAPSPVDPPASERAGDPEVHDLGLAVLVDHDVAGLEVPVGDAQLVGFAQALGDLAGDGKGRPDGQRLRPVDEALQVLAPDVLHRQEEGLPLLVEVVHPADVLVA